MKRVLGAALFALVLAAPRSAAADITNDFRAWEMLCVPGGLSCASWNIRFAYDPTPPGDDSGWGRTLVSVHLSNFQGSLGREDVDPFGIFGLSLHGVHLVSDGAFQNGARFSWTPLIGAPDRPLFEWHSSPELRINPIFGCDDPPPSFTGTEGIDWIRTCGSSSEITQRFFVQGQMSFGSDVDISVGISAHTSSGCTAGNPSNHPSRDDGCVVEVPEPDSYLLMLTGLFGLGVVVRRRREETLAR